MSFEQILEKHEVTRSIEKLVEKVRNAADKCVEDLWSAFLEVGDLDMVRATDAALRLLVSSGDHTKVMKLLEGIYALVEIAPTEDFTCTGTGYLRKRDKPGQGGKRQENPPFRRETRHFQLGQARERGQFCQIT